MKPIDSKELCRNNIRFEFLKQLTGLWLRHHAIGPQMEIRYNSETWPTTQAQLIRTGAHTSTIKQRSTIEAKPIQLRRQVSKEGQEWTPVDEAQVRIRLRLASMSPSAGALLLRVVQRQRATEKPGCILYQCIDPCLSRLFYALVIHRLPSTIIESRSLAPGSSSLYDTAKRCTSAHVS